MTPGPMQAAVRHWACGTAMGAADVIPGVSGGTVALILGVYTRLVTAISHVDGRLLGLVRRRQWGQAAAHLDLPLLVPLAVGILSGFAIMTKAVHVLMAAPTSRSMTLAAFFGMIVASAVLVGRLVRSQTIAQRLSLLAAGGGSAAVALWITYWGQADVEPSLVYLFACGCVAICAMILPGISGAMILFVLGVYIHLTAIPHQLLEGEQVQRGLIELAVFAAGCGVGLIGFSKILRWLLDHYEPPTMAILCGFMFGSLRKLWPFQRDLTPDVSELKHKVFEPYWPAAWDRQVTLVIAAGLAALALVLIADQVVRRVSQAKLRGVKTR